jgi:hypothetical protein
MGKNKLKKFNLLSVNTSLDILTTERTVNELVNESIPIPKAEDMALLVARLARALHRADPDHALPDRAEDYLRRHGLGGSLLRGPSDVSPGVQENIEHG